MPQEEIVQLALMRNCWLRAEEIFQIRLRAISHEWESDKQKATQLRSHLVQGNTKAPAELVFATEPLVDMIRTIRKSRERLDKALKMAIAVDPLASGKGILAEVPEGYISFSQACEILQVPLLGNLVKHAQMVACARAVKVARFEKGASARKSRFCSYYPRIDIERARELDEEERNARLDRSLASASRWGLRGAQPGDISLKRAAKRLGIDRNTLIRKELLPTLRRVGDRWFVSEADVVAFEKKQTALKAKIANGMWLPTWKAARAAGVSNKAVFWKRAKDLGIEAEWLGGKLFYSPADVEKVMQAERIRVH